MTVNIEGMISKVKDDHKYIIKLIDLIDHTLKRKDTITYSFVNKLLDNLFIELDGHIFIEGTIFQGALEKISEEKMVKYLDLYKERLSEFEKSYTSFVEDWKNLAIRECDLERFVKDFASFKNCVNKRIDFEDNEVMDAVLDMMAKDQNLA